MNFPITAAIAPVNYGPQNVAVVLCIDGNAGAIPPQFQFSVLTADNEPCDQSVVAMTNAQWTNWKDQDDEDYIMACVATNLGLTLI